MIKIGINGMGRIGRLVLRSALGGVTRVTGDNNANTQLEITHLNEINSGAETIAHLLSLIPFMGDGMQISLQTKII